MEPNSGFASIEVEAPAFGLAPARVQITNDLSCDEAVRNALPCLAQSKITVRTSAFGEADAMLEFPWLAIVPLPELTTPMPCIPDWP